MSVVNSNPFQLLGVDGAEDVPSPAPAAPKTESAPRTVPGAPQSAGGVKAPDAADPVEIRDSRGASRARGERGPGRSNGRGGRGAGRGGRGSGRGRQFDRHSATGHEDTAKAVRQGWGDSNPEETLKVEEGAKEDAEKEKQAPESKPVVEEEDDNTLTLDQYLAKQAEKRSSMTAQPAPRSVEADESSYGQRLERGQGESYFAGNEKKSTAPKPRKETKQSIEIEPVYTQPQRSERGAPRGGRGGARGGRGGRGDSRGARGGGRGGARGGRGRGPASQGPTVNIADVQAFPSLS
ncbi:hypothetical protein MNAN1_001103 [Malassezia nana]|uniref:Hyaluronan/mRNA-binding protein domain-containing protein n=1 Tax=Malassezia nana TaxID=180528 RepID=A0AAF0EIG0_9BASI|nr:hypothetical protein MNAN1_001103 [Malassezia nana]